jgi:hypothetical protein
MAKSDLLVVVEKSPARLAPKPSSF